MALSGGPGSPEQAQCWGALPEVFLLSQPEPAIIFATLHLPAAPSSTYCQQQQTRSPASRHQHLRKPAAACENKGHGPEEGLLCQAPGTSGGELEKGRKHPWEKRLGLKASSQREIAEQFLLILDL